MSGNHYSKQVAELEHLLDQKLGQLNLLEQENTKLKAREHALQTAIGSRTGALLATKQLMESSNSGGIPSPSNSASTVSGGSVLCAPPPNAAQEPSSASVLSDIEGREEEVQHLLNQVGEGSPQKELYSTLLLRRATSNPARAASHLAMSKQYRLAHLVSWVPKMGVLLPKYDAKGAATATGSAKQQLDYLVDELTEKLLVCGLWDPPEMRFVNLMVNVDTQQYEPYPDGWWQQVAQAVDLTDEQKTAIRIGYERMNGRKTQLIQQHKEVADKVAALQECKREQLRNFNKQAENLPKVLLPALQPPPPQQPQQQLVQQQQQTQQSMQQLQQRLVQQQQQQQAIMQPQQQQQQQMLQAQQWHQSDVQRMQQLQQQSALRQQELMDLQLQHLQQQQIIQQQIFQVNQAQQHPIQQTQQEMLQQLLDDGDDFGLDFDLDMPLMSCGTLAAAAVAALAQDVANEANQQQSQRQTGGVTDDAALFQGSGSFLAADRVADLGSSSGCALNPGQDLAKLPQRYTGSFTFGQQQQRQMLQQMALPGNTARSALSAGGAVAANTAAPMSGGEVSPSSQHSAVVGRSLTVAASAPATALDPAAAAAMPVQYNCGNGSYSACSFAGNTAGSFIPLMAGYQQQQQQQAVQSPLMQMQPSATCASTACQSVEQQMHLQQAGLYAYYPTDGYAVGAAAAAFASQHQQPAQLFEQQQQLLAAGALGGSFAAVPPQSNAENLNQLIGAAAISATPATSHGGCVQSVKVENDGTPGAADSPTPDSSGVDARMLAISHPLAKADTETQEELLLEVFNNEQRELEKQLEKLSRRIKLLMHFQFFHLVNILSKKQLATFYIQSFPFYPDSLSFCEALDELGW